MAHLWYLVSHSGPLDAYFVVPKFRPLLSFIMHFGIIPARVMPPPCPPLLFSFWFPVGHSDLF